MNGLKYAQSFRDLVIYQKSRQLSREIFRLTKSFPKEEMFSLIDQIRRSSRSIGLTSRKHGQSAGMKSTLSAS
jgi:hypothetical protein